MSSTLVPGSLLHPWHLEFSSGFQVSSPTTHTHCYLFLFIHSPGPLDFFPFSCQNWSCCPIFFSSSPPLPTPLSFACDYFVASSCRIDSSTLESSFFESSIWFVGYRVDILSFWANIHLSVNTYHLCSFVSGLPHLGWYFLVPFICLWISWSHCF